MTTSFPTDEPAWLCEVNEAPISVRDCLTCARDRNEPTCPFNVAILKALAAANEPDAAILGLRQVGYPVLRVSSLTGCVRKAWYSLRSTRKLETPSAHWARLRGTVFHAALENMGDGHVERRLTAFLYDSEIAAFITGRIDGYDPERQEITDYKTSRRLPQSVRPAHRRQIHLYAWLLARNGYGIPQSLRIIYISMAKIRSFDLPAPDEGELESLEQELLATVGQILDDEPPAAVPKAKWECKYCPFTHCPAHAEQQSESNSEISQ